MWTVVFSLQFMTHLCFDFFLRTIVSSSKHWDFALYYKLTMPQSIFMTLKQDAIFRSLVALTFQILSWIFFLIVRIYLKIWWKVKTTVCDIYFYSLI